MHFYIGLIIEQQGSDEANTALADARLEELDINKQVPPYKKYLDDKEIERMVQEYKTDSLEELATKVEDWAGEAGGYDEHGLYMTSVWNPNGIIDSWQLFGPNEVKDSIFNEPGVMYCESMITADGTLHRGPIVYAESEENGAALDAWDEEVKAITENSKGKVAYVAECHS